MDSSLTFLAGSKESPAGLSQPSDSQNALEAALKKLEEARKEVLDSEKSLSLSALATIDTVKETMSFFEKSPTSLRLLQDILGILESITGDSVGRRKRQVEPRFELSCDFLTQTINNLEVEKEGLNLRKVSAQNIYNAIDVKFNSLMNEQMDASQLQQYNSLAMKVYERMQQLTTIIGLYEKQTEAISTTARIATTLQNFCDLTSSTPWMELN